MIWVGTSGYNYTEWRGSIYPAGMPTAEMLPYYSARFSSVEINYTFYRMPSEKALANWAETIQEQARGLRDAFVYFKHEDQGKGPEFARMLKGRLGLE